jgi:hypothetical protein
MANARWCFQASIPEATLGPTFHNPVSLLEPRSCVVHRYKSHVRSFRTSVPSSWCSILTFRCSILNIQCFVPSSRQLIHLCSSLDRMYIMFLVHLPSTSKMPPHREVKLLAHVSSVDCHATWLRIVPLGSQTKEPIISSVRKGNRISPTARLTMWLPRKHSNPRMWYWVCSLQTCTM